VTGQASTDGRDPSAAFAGPYARVRTGVIVSGVSNVNVQMPG
jgi:hypothetical protein